jgi:hypothetical protein
MNEHIRSAPSSDRRLHIGYAFGENGGGSVISRLHAAREFARICWPEKSNERRFVVQGTNADLFHIFEGFVDTVRPDISTSFQALYMPPL